MGLKALRAIIAANIVFIIFTLSSCSSKNLSAPGDKSSVLNAETSKKFDLSNNAEYVKSKIEFENMGVLNPDNFYDFISNASFDVIVSDKNASRLAYKIQFNDSLYRIDFYDNENLLKTICYNTSDDAYHLVNFSTNSSIIISSEQISKADNIKPYSLVTPENYGIKSDDYLKYIKKEDVDGLLCFVYDVYNKDNVLVKRIYISGKYKIIMQVNDVLNNVTTTIKNFKFNTVTNEAFAELLKIPLENKKNEGEVPVERND